MQFRKAYGKILNKNLVFYKHIILSQSIAWFEINYMKLNNYNHHLLISGNKNEYMWAKLDQNMILEK